MSSTVLYLAIVAVWAVVLVPMWLRRDTEASGISRLLHKRDDEAEEPEETAAPEPRRRVTRATVIARRRRRTTGLAALLVTAGAVVASGVAPWWVTLPPAALLAGHLALLRVAVARARRTWAGESRRVRSDTMDTIRSPCSNRSR
ncbi:hypothetical protein [Actinomadura geliboluensis]